MQIKNKLINHFILDGRKETGEKNLMKSIKEFQKNSKKNSCEIFQLALINATPVFKLHRLKKKHAKKKSEKFREVPAFIRTSTARVSLAIKFIIKSIKNKSESFYKKFNKEILLNAKNRGDSVETKDNLQKSVLAKKRFFIYYRW